MVMLLEQLARLTEEAGGRPAPAMEFAQRAWGRHVSSMLQPPSEQGAMAELERLLLCYRWEVNAADHDGSTALHAAAQAGQTEILGLLLDSGADVNAQTFCGDTPLHFSASEGHLAATELLIARGAATRAKTVSGATPLARATQHQTGQWGAVTDLLGSLADSL